MGDRGWTHHPSLQKTLWLLKFKFTLTKMCFKSGYSPEYFLSLINLSVFYTLFGMIWPEKILKRRRGGGKIHWLQFRWNVSDGTGEGLSFKSSEWEGLLYNRFPKYEEYFSVMKRTAAGFWWSLIFHKFFIYMCLRKQWPGLLSQNMLPLVDFRSGFSTPLFNTWRIFSNGRKCLDCCSISWARIEANNHKKTLDND